MLSADDWARMRDDMEAIRGDNEISIVIRRGQTTLPVQRVRIVRAGGQGRTAEGQRTEEGRGRVLVMGSTSFDVQPGDRFNDGAGVLYRVVLVQPNRRAAVVAEAEAVQ